MAKDLSRGSSQFLGAMSVRGCEAEVDDGVEDVAAGCGHHVDPHVSLG